MLKEVTRSTRQATILRGRVSFIYHICLRYSISESLNDKIFLGSIPPDPPRWWIAPLCDFFLARTLCLSLCLSVGRSVCYHVFRDYAQQNNKTVIPTGSWLNWLQKRRFSYNYCVQKLWREKHVNKPRCKFAQAYLDRFRSLCVS